MRHPYHLIEPSPWPLLISLNLLFFLLGFVSILGGYNYGSYTTLLSLTLVVLIFSLWLYDVISESIFMGFHSYKTSRGLILGFLFFVLTEIMLFFSLFWAYFHSALNPLFLLWPPIGLDLINPWAVPLLNTLLLLYSGVAATVAHHAFLSNNRSSSLTYLALSIVLGVIFFLLQLFEYISSSYDITDSVYGSSFFILTGGHGLHVIVGVLMLFVTWIRIFSYNNCNLLYDLSLLYYHFVDIVWIALFILIYYMAY